MKSPRNTRLLPGIHVPIAQTCLGACLLAASMTGWADSQDTVVPAAATPSASPVDLGAINVLGQLTGDDQPPPSYAGGQVALGGRIGVLGEQDAADVPFSVVSFTSQLIDNQQDKTIGDVLLNDASVQTAYGYGNFAEIFQIRGFNLAGDDISFGGLYGVLPRQIIQANFVDRVELFKGSNEFANGVSPTGSGIGGTVNLVPKKATDKPITRLGLGYESDTQRTGSLDIGRRYGSQKQFGVRLSAQHAKGDTAIDDENKSDTSIGLALDYRGERARGLFYFGYQRQHIKHGRSVVYVDQVSQIPEPPDAHTNYSASYNSAKLESEFGMLRGEYDLTDDWTAYAAIGANHTEEHGQYGTPHVINDAGDAMISRLGVPYVSHAFTGQAGLRGHFNTGPVSHRMNLGYSGYYGWTGTAYTLSDSVPTNIYHPAHIDYLPTLYQGGDLNDPNVRSRTRTNSWALSDTIGLLDDQLLITLGARYQALGIRNYTYEGEQDGAPITGHRVSPAYGIVYKPTDWLSLYANHIEGIQSGQAAPTDAANVGQIIGLAVSKQNELGAKFDFGHIGGSLALYQIKRPEAYQNSKGVYGYYGEQRNRGIEASIYGKPTARLSLLASATWIDSQLTHTQDGAYDGNDAIGVPSYRVVLAGDWQLPGTSNWAANARIIHTGSQYADTANRLKLDDWTRVDLGLRYKMPLSHGDKNIIWRANIDNVANADYWASAQGGYLSQGEPRTFKLSATFNFD